MCCCSRYNKRACLKSRIPRGSRAVANTRRVRRRNCRRSLASSMGYWGKPIWKIAFQEAKKNWFLMIGFSMTGATVLKMSLGLTPEQAEKSAFVKLHRGDHH